VNRILGAAGKVYRVGAFLEPDDVRSLEFLAKVNGMNHQERMLAACLAAFMLSACAGSQQPMGTLSPASSQVRSGIRPGTSSGDLLYAPDGHAGVYIVTYPAGVRVGVITGVQGRAICSDGSGNVFINDGSQLIEYAHGSTVAINTLNPTGACSWDPTTGNLATVGNNQVAVFSNEQGTPKTYSASSNFSFGYGAYDDAGNLFIIGKDSTRSKSTVVLVELRAGSGAFQTITLSQQLEYPDDLQWDGKYLAIDQSFGGQTHEILRVHVSGSVGKVIGTVKLKGARMFGYGSWIQGGDFISPVQYGNDPRKVYLWSYPSGGEPTGMMAADDFSKKGPICCVTVSVGTSR